MFESIGAEGGSSGRYV